MPLIHHVTSSTSFNSSSTLSWNCFSELRDRQSPKPLWQEVWTPHGCPRPVSAQRPASAPAPPPAALLQVRAGPQMQVVGSRRPLGPGLPLHPGGDLQLLPQHQEEQDQPEPPAPQASPVHHDPRKVTHELHPKPQPLGADEAAGGACGGALCPHTVMGQGPLGHSSASACTFLPG